LTDSGDKPTHAVTSPDGLWLWTGHEWIPSPPSSQLAANPPTLASGSPGLTALIPGADVLPGAPAADPEHGAGTTDSRIDQRDSESAQSKSDADQKSDLAEGTARKNGKVYLALTALAVGIVAILIGGHIYSQHRAAAEFRAAGQRTTAQLDAQLGELPSSDDPSLISKCESLSLSQLASPATAHFHNMSVQDTANGTYMYAEVVNGEVDSENGYGALLTSSVTCGVTTNGTMTATVA
jgi:hypothetical protein